MNHYQKIIFTFFIITSIFNIPLFSQIGTGTWSGKLSVQGTDIPLVFDITDKSGELSSTMDSPSQGATGIPMDVTTFEDNVLTIKFTQGGIRYEGELKEPTEIKGTFYQAGMEFPLNLTKIEKTMPGDTTLPSNQKELDKVAAYDKGEYKYSVEDYFERPKMSGIQFSPDGTYLSYQEKDENGKRHVFVKHTKSGEITKAVEEGEDLIRGYAWANNDRLIFIKDKGGDENYQLFAANLDGSNLKNLTPFDKVRVQFNNFLRDQPNYMIINLNKDNPQIHEPYKLNIVTGEMEKLFENKDASNPIAAYVFDKDGELRGYTQISNGVDYTFFYKTNEKKGFEPIIETNWKSSFSILKFNYATKNPHDAYVITNLESNTSEIVLYDLAKNKAIKTVFGHDTFDASGIGTSRKRNHEVDYYSYRGEKTEIIPVSDYYKKLHKKMEAEFGEGAFSIRSVTDNEDKYLIVVQSDRLYGTYYMYDVKSDKFSELLNLMPQLIEDDMAEMRPVTFKSRDGLTLYGYLTIPKNADKANQAPLIINPHGGPYGIRDNWGFNPETQLFASRGYATLQINYRGSGGYGKKFFLAGNKQIGRKMLNDLEDGVAYAKSLDFIDGDRVAIYGASYGGLATLGSLVKTPDLYKCGIDYVGVSNLFTFFKSFPEYWKPYLRQVYEQWYDAESEEDQKIMREVSPALNVEKITKPLFVIQGANDPRVNIDESDQVVKNMRARGIDVPYMVKYNEGHGFAHEENSIESYKAMLGFFAKHLRN